ncbi:MAG: hypothetical protein ABI808_06400 [Pseudonocardiales bacterium]
MRWLEGAGIPAQNILTAPFVASYFDQIGDTDLPSGLRMIPALDPHVA